MSSTFNGRSLTTKASTLLLVGVSSISAAFATGPVPAAKPVAVPDQVLAPADQALVKDVLVLENRFFCHHYGHDPMEKRLERLELITLGATQAGTNAERLARLKQSVVTRDKSAAKTIATESQKPDSELAGKTNYPVLGTLEWKILKKTHPTEGIDPRLARMETQLFGMPAQSMSYIDRIERLKKTIGMDIASAGPQTPVGPAQRGTINKNQIGAAPIMPRARAGGEGFSLQFGPNGFSTNTFEGNTGIFPGGVTINPGTQGVPGMQANPGTAPKGGQPGKNGNSSGYLYDDKGNVTGFYQNSQHTWSWPGNSEATPAPDGQQNVFEAMDMMNRQMNEMMRHFNSPGMGPEDGINGFSIGIPGGRAGALPRGSSIQISPQAKPQTPQAQPRKFTQPRQELPAYTDPNSI